MQNSTTSPANQRRRISVLWIITIVFLPLIFLSRPGLQLPNLLAGVIEYVGIFLVIGGVLGRYWSILYIGGRKNTIVIQDGPYSMCRHPLYLFSTISVLGFGLMLGSVILTAIMTGVTLYVLHKTAEREEQFLRAEFGDAYNQYAAKTPSILPNISAFQTPQHVTFSVAVLRSNFVDSLAFLALIPIGGMMMYFKEAQFWPTFPLY